MTDKIWAHSGDSHFLEPDDLWHQIMPASQADRMPRTSGSASDEELVEVDGKSFTRKLPKVMTAKNAATGETIAEMSHRPPGARDVKLRLDDLDEEGIWGEVMYQSIGMWCSSDRGPQADRRGRPRRERVARLRDPVRRAGPPRARGADADARRRRRHRRAPARQGHRALHREPPLRPPPGPRGLEPQGVGPAVGGRRGGWHGDRLPHRHQRRPGQVPRSRRCPHQLRRLGAGRAVRRHEARGVRASSSAVPASRCWCPKPARPGCPTSATS